LNSGKFHICASHQVLLGVIKSRRMRSAGHVARIREMGNVCGKLLRKPEGSDRLNDFSVDKIIMIFNL
jgi:hypothetical protein